MPPLSPHADDVLTAAMKARLVNEALTLERSASRPKAVFLQVLKEHCRDAKDKTMRIVS